MIQDEQRRIFDSLKQQAGGVFDALLEKSQSVWSVIGNSLKTALLTAIKDVVTSRVAAMLMQMFTGARVSFAGGGGLLGSIGGLAGVGALPVFGGGMGPGGTAPFVQSGGSGGGQLSGAGLAGFLPGLKSFAGIGGSIQTGAGMATTWGAATMGQKMSAIGKSNAALAGGAMLAMDGLRRGGYAGMAETAAGGAIIGFKYGGPLGTVIGGIAGGIAGFVRLFVKGAMEKAREKVKALYGVDISDKNILQQIVEMAKSSYGGNLDMAIRTPQIRDLIELYGMTTAQKMAPGNIMRPATMYQSGGALYSAPNYSNGTPLPIGGGTPLPIGGGQQRAGAPVYVQLDADATQEFLSGRMAETIRSNPRAVASSNLAATKQNYGRRENMALQFSPSSLTT